MKTNVESDSTERRDAMSERARQLWSKQEEELLKKLYPTAGMLELRKAFPERSLSSLHHKAQNMNLSRNISGRGVLWSKEEDERLRKLLSANASCKDICDAFPHRTWDAIRFYVSRKDWKLPESAKSAKGVVEAPKLEKREWPVTEVFAVDEKKWKEKSQRVGFMSGIDFKDPGFRAGLFRPAFEVFAHEACRYIGLVGRFVSKKCFAERLKSVPAKFRRAFAEDLILEAAKELAYAIPKIKLPGSNNEFVRIYIVTSPTYDGEVGEDVARKLRELRPEDIRVYNPASDRVEVKEVNKVIGLICPEISRLPSEYFSAAVDREVKDKESQTALDYPDIWVVGTHGSSVHIPRHGRKPPIISLPLLKRQQSVRIGENQAGVRIAEYSPDGKEYFVRNYSLKDFIRNERQFITGIKEGAQDIHKKIVDIIKAEGARPEGVIADRLKMENDRPKVNEALKFLLEEKMSPRKTWPGLYYDPHSQRYDFHLDWIQEKLRYPSLIGQPHLEDRCAFICCMHAGYNTTDYEYIVKSFPAMLWKNRVRHIFCCGDLVAGLSHNFLESGEVMGGMNYTEQEQFAAELVGTALMKNFEMGLQELPEVQKFSVAEIVESLLQVFTYIAGNHDDWQKRLGVVPLVTFRSKLINLLAERIETVLKKLNKTLSFGEMTAILNRKVVELSTDGGNYRPIFTLPSGLTVELHHPHMGRAKTKSLRAQEILGSSDAHIVGHGNFHTELVTELWEPHFGQRVNVEAPTFVIFTDFEKHKNKKVDFGPVYLRVLSTEKRIVMSESAFYNTPLLQAPRPKWTDWQKLKTELGIYRSP